ncbi:MAG: TadE/TadG family type IV pilus assembly protein [Acidimicrobiia bacterium]
MSAPLRHREQGQATVELALGLPFVAVLALLLVQATLVGRDQLAVVHAAREAVRAASVDPDPTAAREAARLVVPGARVDMGVRPPPGRPVTVTVAYDSPTDLPLVGPLLPDPRLSARAVMRVER